MNVDEIFPVHRTLIHNTQNVINLDVYYCLSVYTYHLRIHSLQDINQFSITPKLRHVRVEYNQFSEDKSLSLITQRLVEGFGSYI